MQLAGEIECLRLLEVKQHELAADAQELQKYTLSMFVYSHSCKPAGGSICIADSVPYDYQEAFCQAGSGMYAFYGHFFDCACHCIATTPCAYKRLSVPAGQAKRANGYQESCNDQHIPYQSIEQYFRMHVLSSMCACIANTVAWADKNPSAGLQALAHFMFTVQREQHMHDNKQHDCTSGTLACG